MWTTSMIALPSDLHEGAHCTIEFLGETDQIGAQPEEIVDALKEFQFSEPLEVQVLGIRLFGVKTGEPVWVALLDAHGLKPLFENVSERLESRLGVKNMSSYADEEYKPHVTLKPMESYDDLDGFKDFPATITLQPMMLYWNDERYPIHAD